MFKTNARTKTASALTASGDRLRLETPQFMAQCLTDRVPYVMPDSSGGYVLIAEYGDPCPEPKPEDKGTGCGCGGGCADQGKCNKPKNCEQKKPLSRCEQPNRAGLERDDEDRLLRYEIAKYSGYEADGVTLILTQRGVEGTVKQDWPVNTLVMQVMTGAELKDVYSSINGIKSFLDSLGCILSVPRNPDGACGGWDEGDWACFGGKFYRSKENGNCTNAPGDKWLGSFDVFDLLNMYLLWLVDCDGKRINFGEKIATCKNLEELYQSIIKYIKDTICDIPTWSSGTTAHIVKGSDNKYYKANPSGKPDISDPVTQNINQANWFGGYATMCELQQRHFGISAASGNLLQWRDDGVYFGIEAPPNVAVQYVDAINGVDEEFTASGEARGTRALPVKTIKFAIERLPFGTNGTIFLHESQDHLVAMGYASHNNLYFKPYGDQFDALMPSANCPGWGVVSHSYRYRSFMPRIVADYWVEHPAGGSWITQNALTPSASYEFNVEGCILVTTKRKTSDSKPIILPWACFGSGNDNINGSWNLVHSGIFIRDSFAFNGNFIGRGVFYLDKETGGTGGLSAKNNADTVTITMPYNFVDRATLPAPSVSDCDSDYSGIKEGIDIESLFLNYSDQQEVIPGLNTNIPNALINP